MDPAIQDHSRFGKKPIFKMNVRDPEWKQITEPLRTIVGDDVMRLNLLTGDTWMYVGSANAGGMFLHEFYHRCHPTNGRATRCAVMASKNWTPKEPPILV